MPKREINPIEEEIIDIFPDRVPVIPLEQETTLQNIISRKVLRGTRIDNENVLGDKPVSTYARAINTAGNFIQDIINPRIDTATKRILSDFSFGVSGALQIGTYSPGVSGDIKISPAGIVGRNSAGVNTFTIDGATGSATFRGDITGSTITGGTITGSTIRTAIFGKRVEISSTTNDLAFFDTNGNLQGRIDTGVNYLMIRSEMNHKSTVFWARDSVGTSHIVAEFGFTFNNMFYRHTMPNVNNTWNLGSSGQKWANFFRTNDFACDLPTTNSAIDVFKKIKKPVRKEKGDFGARQYFKVEDFPEEMKAKNDKDELDIEMTRTLGVTVQAVKELVDKVELLEKKVKI